MLVFKSHYKVRKRSMVFLLALSVLSIIQSPIDAQVPVVWPMKDGSHDMLTGFCDGMGYTLTKFHPGIDLRGAGTVIVAARAGRIKAKYPNPPDNAGVVIEVDLGDGNVVYDAYGHLQDLTSKKVDKFVKVGERIGRVSLTAYKPPERSHCHFGVFSYFDENNKDNYGVARYYRNILNPFSIFTNEEDQDPQRKKPMLEDNNGDGKAVLFSRQPTMTYIDSPIYGFIDILVEASDDMSPGLMHNQGIHSIGYWIENITGGGANVKTAASPYLLCRFDDNWFSGLPPEERANSRAEYVYDTNFPGTVKPGFIHHYYHYIITNTKGTDGHIKNVDWGQFWRTNAHQDTCANDNCSEVTGEPYIAIINKDAKFKDGVYKIHIVMKDMIHTEYNDDTDVIVDNFIPYVEVVEVNSGPKLIYEAGWMFETIAGKDQLFWVYYEKPGNPTPGEPLDLRITTSETLEDVSLELAGHTVTLSSSASEGMVWEGTVTLSQEEQEAYLLTITGHDTAGNALRPFADTLPKDVPTRSESGDWPSQSNAGDTVHRLGDVEPLTWRMTTPTASTCEEADGGVICPFGEGSDEARVKGSVALLPKGIPTPSPDETVRSHAVLRDPFDQAGLTHTGTYWMVPEGIALRVKPPTAWFPCCDPDGPVIKKRCRESEDYDQATNGPPQDADETTTLAWQMTTHTDDQTNTCQIRMTWSSEDAGPAVVFIITDQTLEALGNEGIPADILTVLSGLKDQPFLQEETLWKAVTDRITRQDIESYRVRIFARVEQQEAVITVEIRPASLCDSLAEDESGMLEASATCTWTAQGQTEYEWLPAGSVNKPAAYRQAPIRQYQCARYWWGTYYDACHVHPEWGQPQPPDVAIPALIQPGEQGFEPSQLTQITFTSCQWEEWRECTGCSSLSPPFTYHRCCYPHRVRLAPNEYQPQREGTTACEAIDTSFTWKGVANCFYENMVSALELPDGPVEVVLGP